MKFNFIKIKNDIFKEVKPHISHVIANYVPEKGSLLDRLRKHRFDIHEKRNGYIASFNFSREVFQSGKWNEVSKLARGLFINIETGEIVARGYEKFFNYKEYKFNSDQFLESHLKFPVTSYKKYNGFLGLLGIDRHNENDKLLFCSKSRSEGEFADYFKSIFREEDHYEDELVKFLDDSNLSLVFEVIDVKNDPHIVKYDKSKIVLLDAIKRQEKFDKLSYEDLQEIGEKFNFNVKEKNIEFKDWVSLKKYIDFINDSDEPGYEGFVFEDMNMYHFKLKGKWYKKWKMLRGLLPRIAKRSQFSTSALTEPEMNYFVSWCKKLDSDIIMNTDIISLRDRFYKECKNI